MADKTNNAITLSDKLKEVMRIETKAWYQKAQIAYAFYSLGGWRAMGYDTIREYVELQLPVSYSYFMYMVKIGEIMRDYGLTPKDLEEINWTKFKEAAVVLGKIHLVREELDKMLHLAREMSYAEFKNWLQVNYGEKKDGFVRMSLTLTQDEAELIDSLAEELDLSRKEAIIRAVSSYLAGIREEEKEGAGVRAILQG